MLGGEEENTRPLKQCHSELRLVGHAAVRRAHSTDRRRPRAGLASRRSEAALRAGWRGSAPAQGLPDRPGARLLPGEGKEEGGRGGSRGLRTAAASCPPVSEGDDWRVRRGTGGRELAVTVASVGETG